MQDSNKLEIRNALKMQSGNFVVLDLENDSLHQCKEYLHHLVKNEFYDKGVRKNLSCFFFSRVNDFQYFLAYYDKQLIKTTKSRRVVSVEFEIGTRAFETLKIGEFIEFGPELNEKSIYLRAINYCKKNNSHKDFGIRMNDKEFGREAGFRILRKKTMYEDKNGEEPCFKDGEKESVKGYRF